MRFVFSIYLNDIPLNIALCFALALIALSGILMRSSGAHVTLWDEIAPPSPRPIPVDTPHAAQDDVQRNVAT
jgi:hypothetical protein